MRDTSNSPYILKTKIYEDSFYKSEDDIERRKNMSTKRGTSVVPLVMGIIGSVIQLPGAICAGACAAGVSALADKSTKAGSELTSFYMGMGLAAALIGFISGLIGKKNPTFSGIGFLAATVLSGITLVTFNFFSMVSLILFLIGGIFAFIQKKEEIQ